MKALQLGRYHLLDRIAFGGMAEIYRAKTFDAQGRVHMVAVKRILSHLGRDEEFIRMLVDEARIASLMQHENIAKTYEFCHAQGEYFIAMEHVDGKDGRTLLDRCRAQRRWIPPELCAFIMMHTLRALHCAHNQTDRHGRPMQLIHRDVSPSNVICSYSGEVKLCDFGIAKASLSRVQTRSGVIKGKVKYMSPEQAMGRKLDLRSDIFSAGSVLYEFLTKVPPFLAPNEMELLVLVRETRYRPVRERNPMVPPALEAIVDTAMSRSLEGRFQTAAEFADALEQYLRIHAPRITRSHLGQFVRQLFADDIERELRALEEYVVEDHGTEEVGVNLIAEDLPPGADYAQFSASPTSHLEPGDLTPQEMERGEIEVAARRAPQDDPTLGRSPTVILESSDLIAADGTGTGSLPGNAVPDLGEDWRQYGFPGEAPSAAPFPPPAPDAVSDWRQQSFPLGSAGGPAAPPAPEAPSAGYAYGAIDPHLAAQVLAQDGLHDAKTVILDLDEAEAPSLPGVASEAGPGPGATRPAVAPAASRAGAPRPPAGGMRYVHTLSGTGPHEPAPPAVGPGPAGDLHDLPTGEIETTDPHGLASGAPAGEGTQELDVEDLREVAQGQGASDPRRRTDRIIGAPFDDYGEPAEETSPGVNPAYGAGGGAHAPVPGDIVSVLSAPPSGGTAEIEVSDLVEVAAALDRQGETAELDVEDLEEVAHRVGRSPRDALGGTQELDVDDIAYLHDRGTDLIELPEDQADPGAAPPGPAPAPPRRR